MQQTTPFVRTVLSRRLRVILAHARNLGIDVIALLSACGTEVEHFLDQDQRVPEAKELEIWRRCLDASGDPDFGLHALETVDFRVFRDVLMHTEFFLLQALAASATAGEGLARFARYYPAVSDSLRVRLAPRPDGTVIARHLFSPAQRALPAHTEFMLGIEVRTLAALAAVPVAPIEVCLAHSPTHSPSERERILRAPIRFDCGEYALIYSADALAQPLLSANERLAEELDRRGERLLANVPPAGRLLDGARAILERELAKGDPGAASVALELGMSSRTLTRKLAQLDTSYQELLDETRTLLAFECLDSGLDTSEIAARVGFSESSALQRAFRRRVGFPIGEYRRRGCGAPLPLPAGVTSLLAM